MKKIIAGVIGCGSIARFHFSGLEKAGSTIKWVCDIAEAPAKPWVERFKAKYTPSYMDIINDPEVNLISVTSFSSTHKDICLKAIKAQKAVICEKTLAENADDSLEIVKSAEKKKTIFYTSYMKRFIPAVEKAKSLMPSLGKIISTHIRAYQCWGDLWTKKPADGFFSSKSGKSIVVQKYGGGILVCGGSHILDLICFFLGRPVKVSAMMHKPDYLDFDIQAAALFETNNGVVHYEALAHPLNKIGFLRDGWDERMEINGTNGRLEIYSAEWSSFDHKPSMLLHYDNATGTATEYRYSPVSPFDRAIAFFCGNIIKGKQGTQSRITGYDVDELIAHINLSAKSGKTVPINWRI